MNEAGVPKFVRPTGTEPTPHVLIGGAEADLLHLRDALQRLGAIRITDPVPPRLAHCYASFSSAAEAAAALDAISALPPGETAGRVVAHFADVAAPRPSPDAASASAMPIPAVRTAAECNVQGLSLLHDFVSREEEAAVLAAVDTQPWELLARRRVQHYGTKFSYVTRSVDPAAPTPDFPAAIKPLLERVCSLPGVGSLDQLTVNEYPPGVGLSPHIDTHSAFGDAIVSLSLAGPAAMVFRKRGTGEQRSVLLPERSLLIMTDAARFEWEHYIPHRKSDPLVDGDVVPRTTRRVSLTFRLVRQGPCQCQYPEHCDSQKGEIPPTRMAQTGRGAPRAAGTQLTASAGASTRAPESGDSLSGTAHQQLEDENVRDVYDAIAGHFSATRFAIWPRVREFIESLPPGALVADVGCGNGKYFGARRDIFVAGSDRSKGLAEVAARRLYPPGRPPSDRLFADVAVADAMKLPYRACCDGVLCIAVLHHISSVDRRVRMLAELASILAPGGRAIVTVWATEQENMKKVAKWQPLAQGKGRSRSDAAQAQEDGGADGEGNDYLVPWHLPLHRAEAAAVSAKSVADAEMDVGKNALVFKRYYHLFGPEELEGLVARVPGVSVVDSFYDRDNWCVVFRKDG